MRRGHRVGRWLWLLASLLSSCDRVPPATAVAGPAVEAAAREPFEPPASDGWGRAEGLSYREFVRGSAAPDQPLPMVIILHGMGDQPGEHWFDAIPIDFPARVIMPQAPAPYLGGFSWFTYRVGDNEPHALGRGIAEAEGRLSRALAALRAERPTLGRPIVTGFSQGGMLSFALAVRHPEQLVLAVPISGTLPAPIWPAARAQNAPNTPIRALHGTTDTVVPFEPTRELVTELARLGFDASLQTFEGVGHTISPEMKPAIARSLREAVSQLRESRR
jgi:phospholipase/carboxylesterase